MDSDHVTEIQECARKQRIPIGEALLMIRNNFGWMWEDIQPAKTDEIKRFLVNNNVDRLKIIDPVLHEVYMEHPDMGEYQRVVQKFQQRGATDWWGE